MDRTARGAAAALVGAIVFLVSLFFLLPVPILYVPSLLLMFIGVVIIGVGSAVAKGFDKNLDEVSIQCYFCKGSGRIDGINGKEVCPRCGGSGVGRSDDVAKPPS